MRLKKQITFTITLVVEPDDDRFHAYCPALKGLHTEGATHDEACKNAVAAAAAYITSLIKHGESIPLGVEKKETPRRTQTTAKPRTCVHQIPVMI